MAQLFVPVVLVLTVQKDITVSSLQSYQRPTLTHSQSDGESVHYRPLSAGTDVNLQQTTVSVNICRTD